MKSRTVAHQPIDRRTALIGGAALLLSGASSSSRAASPAADGIRRLRALERRAKGRLGAYVLDTANGAAFGWREHERFTQASSFKMSLAAMLLAEADAGRVDLRDVLHWTRSDMLPVSPVTTALWRRGFPSRNWPGRRSSRATTRPPTSCCAGSAALPV